jgi:hypothetical protein
MLLGALGSLYLSNINYNRISFLILIDVLTHLKYHRDVPLDFLLGGCGSAIEDDNLPLGIDTEEPATDSGQMVDEL